MARKKRVKEEASPPPSPEPPEDGKKKKGNNKGEVELEEQVFVADYQVPLTNKEVMEKGVELADCHREQDGIAEELKEAKDDAKAKLSPVEARIKELVRQIYSKKEQREVECQRRWKWGEGIMDTIRADTGKILATRKISDYERQMKFPEKSEGEPLDGAKDAHAFGVDAALTGAADTENPYEPETNDHASWNEGWLSAQKGDDQSEPTGEQTELTGEQTESPNEQLPDYDDPAEPPSEQSAV